MGSRLTEILTAPPGLGLVVILRVLIFVSSLYIMMMLAERLPVVRVPEELRITSVRTDVIHDRRLDVPAFALTLHAQWV